MKLWIVFCLIGTSSLAWTSMNMRTLRLDQNWINMPSGCVKQTRIQIQEEMAASMQYLAIAAYFSQDTINRPGFGNLFFEAASAERDHSSQLIEYFLMRGELTTNVTALLKVPLVSVDTWSNCITALNNALSIEIKMIDSIRNLIAACQLGCNNVEGKCDGFELKYNDYYTARFLIQKYLGEHYKRQDKLVGIISKLGKIAQNENIGEFLIDKEAMRK